MGSIRPFAHIRAAADVRATSDRLGSKFFSPGAMAFFASRLTSFHAVVADVEDGTQSGLIITSERYGDDAPRHFTLRRYTVTRTSDEHGPVDSIDFHTIARFETKRAAENGAAILTSAATPERKAELMAAFAIDGEVEL